MGRTTRLLGGWGYIAWIAGGLLGFFVGPFTGLITLGGAVCVLIAFYRAGDELKLPSVKHEMTIAIVLNVVAYLLFFFMVAAALAAYLARTGRLDNAGNAAAVAFGGSSVFAAFVAWIFTIIGGWFWYKASESLARGTGVGIYKTGGLLIFIGSITIVVAGLGFLVTWVGQIIQTVAFFSTPEEAGGAIGPPSQPAN